MDGSRLLRVMIFLTLVLLLSACSDVLAESQTTDEPPLLGTLTLSRSGCSLELVEDSVAPGAYAIEVVIDGPGGVFDMWTILPGQTYEGFAEQIEEARVMAETESDTELSLRDLPPPQGVESWRRFGVDGQSQTIHKYLSSGTYVIVCQEFVDPAGWWPMYEAGPIEVE